MFGGIFPSMLASISWEATSMLRLVICPLQLGDLLGGSQAVKDDADQSTEEAQTHWCPWESRLCGAVGDARSQSARLAA